MSVGGIQPSNPAKPSSRLPLCTAAYTAMAFCDRHFHRLTDLHIGSISLGAIRLILIITVPKPV